MNHGHTPPDVNTDVASDETLRTRDTEKPARRERSMNGALRALDYRKGTRRYHRCSRCHAEREDAPPIIYNADGSAASQTPLVPIMVGQDLLGFTCNACFHSLVQHIAAVFPDNIGFPLVDHHGMLIATPRCDECGSTLAYATDGKSVLCPQCDVEHL